MDSKFSPRVKDVLSFSKDEAERLGNSAIGTEHLFLGILREGEGVAINILSSLGINLLDIKHDLEFKLQNTNLDRLEQEDIPLQKSAERVLKLIYLEAKALKNQTIDTSHLLLAILKDEKCLVTRYLDTKNIDYNTVKNNIRTSLPKAQADFPSEGREETGGMHGGNPKPVATGKSSTPVLDNFGVDITQAAEEGALDPIVGREVEIERLAQILSRRKKNNPILIGEPGVGKSAIVEGLALRILSLIHI